MFMTLQTLSYPRRESKIDLIGIGVVHRSRVFVHNIAVLIPVCLLFMHHIKLNPIIHLGLILC